MAFKKGPYLQKPEKDSVLILWETDVESLGEVYVYSACLPHVSRTKTREIGAPRIFRSTETGMFHTVKISGLSAATEYYYEVRCDAGGNGRFRSEKVPFWTAPENGDACSFVLTAELGGVGDPDNPYLAPIRDLIGREHPDFIQSVGDLLHMGTKDEDWDTYLFTPFRSLLDSIALYPCTSNHELSAGGTCIPPTERAEHYKNYEHYFSFPPTYSYDYGCAHFCVLDCLDFFTCIEKDERDVYIPRLREDWAECETYRFLKDDLKNAVAKWKFVVFHYPLYTSSQYDVRELRVLSPLFEEFGVDVVFNSHAIVYERMHPMKGERIDPHGVHYILVGGYGDFEGWFREKRSPHSAKLAARPCYVHVALTPWRLELQAIDHEGKLFDSLILEK